MKIAIVTFHRAYNYGAVLQCYALQKTLQAIGVDCDVLDYAPSYFERMYNLLPERLLSKKGLKQAFVRTLMRKYLAERCRNFEKFLDEYLILSKDTYHTAEALEQAELPYDALIAGSDQVWNDVCAKFDPVFFLYGKAFEGKKKYSYAASFGFSALPSERRDDYLERLKDYRMISVREKNGSDILEELLDKRSVVSCDPTFLHSSDEWKQIAGDKPLIAGNYIFLYHVKLPTAIRSYAAKLSEKTGCRVVCVSCHFHGSPKNIYSYQSGRLDKREGFQSCHSCSPAEFLNYILYAKYVLSSSFHGTVFSILFHKQFLSQTVWKNEKPNERVINLLKQLGLQERTINQAAADIDAPIDWDSVDSAADNMRQNGKQYLENLLSDVISS